MVYSPKKLIAFIATVAAALSLQACGPMPNSSNQPAQPTIPTEAVSVAP